MIMKKVLSSIVNFSKMKKYVDLVCQGQGREKLSCTQFDLGWHLSTDVVHNSWKIKIYVIWPLEKTFTRLTQIFMSNQFQGQMKNK